MLNVGSLVNCSLYCMTYSCYSQLLYYADQPCQSTDGMGVLSADVNYSESFPLTAGKHTSM